MITLHALIARDFAGKTSVLAASFDDFAPVLAAYNRLTDGSEEARAFQAETEEVLCIRDFREYASHTFENPASVERNRKAAILREAVAAREKQLAIEATAEDALEKLKIAEAGVKSLSKEHKQALTEHDKAEAARKAAAEKPAEDLATQKGIAEEKAAAEKKAAEENLKRQSAAAGESAGKINTLATPTPSITVPTLEEVIKAGYKEDVAKGIVAREQAKADALAKNPNLTAAELDQIGAEAAAKLTKP